MTLDQGFNRSPTGSTLIFIRSQLPRVSSSFMHLILLHQETREKHFLISSYICNFRFLYAWDFFALEMV